MLDSLEIAWACPNCGYANVDDIEQTALPMCGVCLFAYDWDNVLEGPCPCKRCTAEHSAIDTTQTNGA